MSRGAGKVERAIAELVAECRRHREPVLISTEDVVRRVYGALAKPSPETDKDDIWGDDGDGKSITPEWRKSVTRAMHTFVAKNPKYALANAEGRIQLYLYEKADPKSRMLMRLTMAEPDRNIRPRDVWEALEAEAERKARRGARAKK